MAVLHPFRALRPLPAVVKKVACVPYDVIDTREARALAEGNERSFLHVIRPEIDLPPGTDEHADAVYEKGAENLRAYAASDESVQEREPSLYVYRIVMNGRAQTGLYGCVAVADYDDDTILKHEKTRPDKEDDRTRHILTQQAHAEPVMLAFRDDEAVRSLMAEAQQAEPLYDFEAEDGIRHTVWQMPRPQAVVEAFAQVPTLYVADGHHRCKAASRAFHDTESASPDDEVAFFPAALFPSSELQILAYNRIVKVLPQGAGTFLDQLKTRFDVRENVPPVPEKKGDVSLYLVGTWYGITLPPTEGDATADTLDVARLGEHVLEPLLGITDPRTDQNLSFVGGIRGTAELEKRVDSGEADLGISMYPTGLDELFAVSDAGELMPPKSTWFEPKLRSGLLVHLFGGTGEE